MPKILKSDSEDCYLIGKLIEKLNDESLPSNNAVLSRFVYCRTNGKKTMSESLKECGTEVENIWASANIPTQNHYRVLNKVKSLYAEWIRIKKNKARNSESQRQLEEIFSTSLQTLFDISYNDCRKKMNSEDKERLGIHGNDIRVTDKLIERKEYWNRPVQIQRFDQIDEEIPSVEIGENHSIDTSNPTNCAIYETKDIRSNDVFDAESNLDEKEYVCCAKDISLAVAEVDFDSSSDSDEEYLPPSKYRKKTTKKKQSIMTPELSSALDRTKTSNRAAVFILALAAVGMGLNPENMVINRESIRLARLANSKEITIQMRENFNPDSPLVLHWDGKMLPNSNLDRKVDRIAVVVTGKGVSQTLDIPFLEQSATGKTQADLVLKTVATWKNVPDKIKFLCSDTTSVNSGRIKGTRVWIEKLTGN